MGGASIGVQLHKKAKRVPSKHYPPQLSRNGSKQLPATILHLCMYQGPSPGQCQTHPMDKLALNRCKRRGGKYEFWVSVDSYPTASGFEAFYPGETTALPKVAGFTRAVILSW